MNGTRAFSMKTGKKFLSIMLILSVLFGGLFLAPATKAAVFCCDGCECATAANTAKNAAADEDHGRVQDHRNRAMHRRRYLRVAVDGRLHGSLKSAGRGRSRLEILEIERSLLVVRLAADAAVRGLSRRRFCADKWLSFRVALNRRLDRRDAARSFDRSLDGRSFDRCVRARSLKRFKGDNVGR